MVGGRPDGLAGRTEPSDLSQRRIHRGEILSDRLFSTFFPTTPLGWNIGSRAYRGWFIGAGDEYALSFVPGLFWKTEYRLSELDAETNPIRVTATGAPIGVSVDSQKRVHTVRSELVYRFNWGGGPVLAKY